MTYFATINQTRHGYTASFGCRSKPVPSEPFPAEWDIPGRMCWRRTRRGIERAAARVIRRLEADGRRHADSYEYTSSLSV